MLGQIDFAPWQCLAELVDNSIDAFIDAKASGHPVASPMIAISLPSQAELDAGQGVVVVRDNALGMSLEDLSKAVKAGYSGNDPVDKMGLFGMGFNISTARLGRRTEVWTTTSEAADWTGVVIDFDDLERAGTFHAPLFRKPKSARELDTPTHGTTITVSRLEAERLRPLRLGAGKGRTKQRLGKIYGKVMSDLGISITYDGDGITPWRHCVWSPSRTVPTADFGNVPAMLPIDVPLAPRRYCTTCWVWLTDTDTSCSACGNLENVIERGRRVKGWIGIQRYFDKSHYGFDLLRNGRVIEELDKSMFTFRDQSGEELFEYPRDAIHWGGRIVGELEIDFVRVSHQKDSFDKLDPEWKHVVHAIRGQSPLQPLIADRMSLPRNTSPLARLFAGYRKGIAGLKSLVPGDLRGVGTNAGPVKEYTEKFYEGVEGYQDDSKWYDLVLQAERATRGDSSGADSAAGPIPGTTPTAEETAASGAGVGAGGQTPESAVPVDTSEVDPELSQGYELPMLPGSPRIAVTAHRHGGLPVGHPFAIEPNGYTVRYDYYPKAAFFEESLQTPADCLIVDLAQHFLALSAGTPREMPVSQIAHEIRKRYFPKTLTDASAVADEAEAMLVELRSHYDQALPSVAPIDPAGLDPALVAKVRQRAFSADGANEERALASIRSGQFARHLDNQFLVELVHLWPQLVTDGSFFSMPLNTLASELRASALARLASSLQEVLWLADEASGAVSKDTPWRLLFARALGSLRLLQSWRV